MTSGHQILSLTGWTSQEINHLVNDQLCPDHWHDEPKPTYALLEAIRIAIDDSPHLSYRKDFIRIIKSMGLKEPPIALVTLISKMKRKAVKAEKTGDWMQLCLEMTEFTVSVVGQSSQRAGITPQWLQNGTQNIEPNLITNGVITELYHYRRLRSIGWKTVIEQWWPKLFPERTYTPSIGTVISSWESVAQKKILLNRNKSQELKEEFLNSIYTHPSPKAEKPQAVEIPIVEQPESVGSDEDSGYTTSDSDEGVSPYLLRRHGDTIKILHELLEAEKQEKSCLEKELADTKTNYHDAQQRALEAEESRKASDAALQVTVKEHKKTCSKYEKELKKANELCEKLGKQIQSLQATNVVRRLATRERDLEKEREDNIKLQKEVSDLNCIVTELRRVKKNRTEQVRYNVIKRTEAEEKLDTQNIELKQQLKELEKENDILRSNLDEIMGNKAIESFEDGMYNADIRVVCYELISRGVSSKHVTDIIRLVLKRVAGLDCGRLPKPTCIRYMAFEQALLSKHIAKEAIATSKVPVTLMTDGTTKKHQSYVTMLASTETGTYGLGLGEVVTETGDGLLHEAIEAMTELLALENLNEGETKKLAEEYLLKVKNTMTDRCIVNKKFVQLLEEWREKVLQQTSGWDLLSEEAKDTMTAINDFYCGKHLILNLQEYAGGALKEWEQVETTTGKLGREKHLPWNRKNESATFLAIRTVCEAYGPDASEQAGSPNEFNGYLEEIGERSHLLAYRGNRFNIPFQNGAAVYYHHHHNHINDVYSSLPIHKQNNQLSRSVKYDLQDPIIIGGIRAMGIINTHITQPIMHMLETANIPILQTSSYYTRVHNVVSEWMVNPQPLLDDSALMFEDFVPKKDLLHSALYETVSEEIEFNTRQALSIILHNMYVCIMRQVGDHLPGGKFHNTTANMSSETQSCPKDNIASERVFAGLDYLKRKSPNISALAMQGIILWTQNKTKAYLDKCSPNKREHLIKKAATNRKIIQKQYQEKVKDIKRKRREDVEERKKAQALKEKKLIALTVSNTDCVMKTCGYVCKSDADVDKLISQKKEGGDSAVKEALLSQIRYFKSVNRGLVKGSLFFVTSAGKPLETKDLAIRLKEIIKQIDTQSEESADEQLHEVILDKQQQRETLRQKLLSKLSSSASNITRKRKRPSFPDDIVNKRIRHICLDPSEELVTYKGHVVRESSNKDIEELMEEMYRPYLDKGYKFFTVMYDPPYNQLYCYPLKKEWDDGLLSLM